MSNCIVNLKDMLVDKFVMDASNEKADLRQIDLKVGNVIRTCFVVSKKKNIVQIKSIFSDDTVEELEIEFVQNSLKMVSAKASTYLYKGGMDLQLISEKEIESLDLNKYAVSVGDLYVPVNVLLTPYFKEKATNVVLSGAIKSLNMVSDNRIKSKDDNSKEIKLHTVIDLNVYDKDNKIVEDVKNLSSKNIAKLSKINDNVLYMSILADNYNTDKIVSGTAKNHNVVNTFNETEFVKECANKMKDYMAMENKSELEITAFLMSKMSKEDCELLLNNKMFRESVMLGTTDENTLDIDSELLGNGLFEIQGLSSLKEEDKIDLVMDLSMMVNKDKIKDIGIFKAQVRLLLEENNKDDIKDKEEVKMENVIDELQNDVVILNAVEKRFESIKAKYQPLVTSGQLKMVIEMALVLGEEIFNKIENEQVFRTMFGLKIDNDIVNNKEAAMTIAQTLQIVTKISDLKSSKLDNEEELNKQLSVFKITDSMDNVINKEEFISNVLEIVERITKGEDKVETFEAEVVNNVVKQENVAKTKVENKSTPQEIVVARNNDNKVSNNKVYTNMVKYICDTLGDAGLVKYNNELTMIHDMLGKETLGNIAKSNKSINDILTRYTRDEINKSIAKGFEVVGDLLTTLKKNIHGCEEIGALIKLPLDIKVKLVYSLLEMNDVMLETMSIEDRALFYIILNKSLNVTLEDMRQKNSSGDFTLARARVSVANREVVNKHIA